MSLPSTLTMKCVVALRFAVFALTFALCVEAQLEPNTDSTLLCNIVWDEASEDQIIPAIESSLLGRYDGDCGRDITFTSVEDHQQNDCRYDSRVFLRYHRPRLNDRNGNFLLSSDFAVALNNTHAAVCFRNMVATDLTVGGAFTVTRAILDGINNGLPDEDCQVASCSNTDEVLAEVKRMAGNLRRRLSISNLELDFGAYSDHNENEASDYTEEGDEEWSE